MHKPSPTQRIKSQRALKRACAVAGGQRSLAAKIGTSQPQISFWLNDAKAGVPREFCERIENATNGAVTKEELRPDLFAKYRFSKIDDFGPALRGLGGLQTSNIRALKGSTFGAASAGRKLTPEERKSVEAQLRADGKI